MFTPKWTWCVPFWFSRISRSQNGISLKTYSEIKWNVNVLQDAIGLINHASWVDLLHINKIILTGAFQKPERTRCTEWCPPGSVQNAYFGRAVLNY